VRKPAVQTVVHVISNGLLTTPPTDIARKLRRFWPA
jgi:hypothetical protein